MFNLLELVRFILKYIYCQKITSFSDFYIYQSNILT